ncbi:MAG: hypothetical protein WC988_00780 [Patescibacteria group bacterium]
MKRPENGHVVLKLFLAMFVVLFLSVTASLIITKEQVFRNHRADSNPSKVPESTTSAKIEEPIESTPAAELAVLAAEQKPTESSKSTKVLGTEDASGQVFYSRTTANNKVGMYVHNITDDIKAAAKLINSGGGKWGYVLLTMDIKDGNESYWQELFDAASKSQLIPIVQISNNNVCKPDKMDFEELAKTLNSVKWPSKHRYITVFNEMNSKDYWCQKIAPEEYAQALDKAIKAFKKKSDRFFIMPGAFNSSARTQDRYLSEDAYLSRMDKAVPGIFKKIDGWATHSYPHPNFSGDINNLPAGYSARDTINNYTWELGLLKKYFGVGPLPVFITETGWLHKEGQNGCVQYSQSNLLSTETVSKRYKDAFVNYWLNDVRIVAVTPFIFRSSDPCASGFAWQKSDGSWYPQAKMLMAIPKTAGSPD